MVFRRRAAALLGLLSVAAAHNNNLPPIDDPLDVLPENFGESIPPEFDWPKESDELPGFEASVHAGEDEIRERKKVEPWKTFYDDLPPVVDVALHTNADEIPEKLPVDFIMMKVMERFDLEVPGYKEVLPGDPLDGWVPEIDPDGGVDEVHHLPSLALSEIMEDPARVTWKDGDPMVYKDQIAAEQAGEEEEHRRRLAIYVCPTCRRRIKWKRCIKNLCKASNRRRRQRQLSSSTAAVETPETSRNLRGRRLSEVGEQERKEHAPIDLSAHHSPDNTRHRMLKYDWDKEEAVPDALEDSEYWRNLAQTIRFIASEHLRKEEVDVASVLNEKAQVLEDMAALLSEKATQLMDKYFLHDKANQIIDHSGVEDSVKRDINSEEKEVMLTKVEIKARKEHMKELKKIYKEAEKYSKQMEKYEKVWMKAMEVLSVTTDDLKAIGKMEHALNQVVRWFSKSYGAELGIEVERLA